MKATIRDGAVILEGSIAEIAGFFQGRPQTVSTTTVSQSSVTSTPFIMTRATVSPAPKRAYNKMRTKKAWKRSEEDYLLANWYPQKAGHSARSRKRHNTAVAKQLRRTFVACSVRHGELRRR